MNYELIGEIILMGLGVITIIFFNGIFWYMYKEDETIIYIPFAIFVNLLTIGSALMFIGKFCGK